MKRKPPFPALTVPNSSSSLPILSSPVSVLHTAMDIKNLVTSQDDVPHCDTKESQQQSFSPSERPIQPRYDSSKNLPVSSQQSKDIPWDLNHRPTEHTPWEVHTQQTGRTPWRLSHAPAGHIPCEVDFLSGSEKKSQQRKKNAMSSKKARDKKRQQEQYVKYQEQCIEVQDKKIMCLLKLLGFDSEDQLLLNVSSVTDWPSKPSTPQHMSASESTSVATSPTLSNI